MLSGPAVFWQTLRKPLETIPLLGWVFPSGFHQHKSILAKYQIKCTIYFHADCSTISCHKQLCPGAKLIFIRKNDGVYWAKWWIKFLLYDQHSNCQSIDWFTSCHNQRRARAWQVQQRRAVAWQMEQRKAGAWQVQQRRAGAWQTCKETCEATYVSEKVTKPFGNHQHNHEW